MALRTLLPVLSLLSLLPILSLLSLLSRVSAAIIDLSHTQTSQTFHFPDVIAYDRTHVTADDALGIYVDRGVLIAPEHSGTHIDAPSHFVKDGWTLEDIPIEKTIADGVTIDCRREVRDAATRYTVPLQKIYDWESAHGQIPERAAILFNFGWSAKWDNLDDYLGTTNHSDFSSIYQPGVSPEAGLWLIRNRNPKIIAVDTLSPDVLQSHDFPIHVEMLKRPGLIVENLRIPGNMPARGFRFHATPPKYRGASGNQVRAFAVIGGDDQTDTAHAASLCRHVLIGSLMLVMAVLYN